MRILILRSRPNLKINLDAFALSKVELLFLRKEFRDFKDKIENLNLLEFKNENQFKLLSESKAQLHQDLFVLSELKEKRKGFFVEFGATDGVEFSNTWLLENNYDWQGILAEPAKCFHKELKFNRNCIIDTRCVFNNTGSMMAFNGNPPKQGKRI